MLEKKDYLPLVKNMSAEDFTKYCKRLFCFVEKNVPLRNAFADIFDEGVKLVSALRSHREVIPLLYKQRYSVSERESRLNDLLLKTKNYCSEFGANILLNASNSSTAIVTEKTNHLHPNIVAPTEQASAKRTAVAPKVKVAKERPEHISEYLHLLPAHIQSEYKGIQELYNEMAYGHSCLEALVLDNATSSRTERARFAQFVCRKEDRINNFWRRVDAYWELSQGLEVSDDTIKELEEEADKFLKADNEEPPTRLIGSYSKAEIDIMPDGELKDNAKKARILRNQKFLRRTDRQRVDLDAFKVAVEEMHEWGYWITAKQAAAAAAAGFTVPEEYIEPPVEERNKASKKRYEDKRNAEKRARNAELRKMREEIKEDNPYKQAGLNFLN